MNVDGRVYPNPHPDWGQCAEELFYYSSRYLMLVATAVSVYSDKADFNLKTYQAKSLSSAQRACMARLLARPPTADTAAALRSLIDTVVAGDSAVPKPVADLVGLEQARPAMCLVAGRPWQSTGISDLAPLDLMQHLASRYHFPLRVSGRNVWLNCERCDRILHTGSRMVQQNILEALRLLNRAGYTVYSQHTAVRKQYKTA